MFGKFSNFLLEDCWMLPNVWAALGCWRISNSMCHPKYYLCCLHSLKPGEYPGPVLFSVCVLLNSGHRLKIIDHNKKANNCRPRAPVYTGHCSKMSLWSHPPFLLSTSKQGHHTGGEYCLASSKIHKHVIIVNKCSSERRWQTPFRHVRVTLNVWMNSVKTAQHSKDSTALLEVSSLLTYISFLFVDCPMI